MKNLLEYDEYSQEKDEYTFDELPPEAKEKALDKQRDINVDSDSWYEPIIDGFIEDMEEFGINIDIEDVQFTGFYSQGDGASFTCNNIDSDVFLRAIGVKDSRFLKMDDEDEDKTGLRNLANDLGNIGFDKLTRIEPDEIEITFRRNSSQYSHENTVSVDMVVDIEDKIRDLMLGDGKKRKFDEWQKSLENQINDWRKAKCKELYKKLGDDWEYLQKDSEVEETILINDYRFDLEGNIVG
jgi:hypothetical protein